MTTKGYGYRRLTQKMQGCLNDLMEFGEIVQEDGGWWRPIGKNAHSKNRYHATVVAGLNYRGFLEVGAKNERNRPIVYHFISDWRDGFDLNRERHPVP